MNRELLKNKSFEQGLADYFYLIDRGYPEKGALKLVGDRYKLNSEFRTILYRGVSPSAISSQRRARLTNPPFKTLLIDGYNDHLESLMEKHNVKGSVYLTSSADKAIIESLDGTTASSDSAVIDHCSNPVFDIPRYIFEQKYNAELYNLKNALPGITS